MLAPIELVGHVTASLAGCRACPLAETRTHIVDGQGASRVRLFIVGEAPGAEEDKVGAPFVGQSGKLLRATLAAAGCPEGQYYLTNTVKCRPPANRDPKPNEIDCCSTWLIQELSMVQYDRVLLLGKKAQEAFSRPDVVRAVPEGVPIVNAWHPAYVLRSPRVRAQWEQQIWAAARGERSEPLSPVQLSQFIPRQKYWAADTETDDLDEGVGVKCVAWTLSDGHESQFREGFTAIGGTWHLPHVYLHNAKYDAPLLGIDLKNLRRWDDTMLMAYCARYREVGLKKLAPRLTGLQLHDISEVLGVGKKRMSFSEARRRNPTFAETYAEQDALATARLAYVLDQQLQGGRRQYYERVEKPFVAPLLDMEQRGVQVDPDRLQNLHERLDRDIQTITESLKHMYGLPDTWSHRKRDDLTSLLAAHGAQLVHTTPKSGVLKVDDQILQGLIGQERLDQIESGGLPANSLEAIVTCVRKIRKLEKLDSTYARPLLDARDAQSRIHARFNQAVTETNRLSSSEPNLQNQPIRGDIKTAIRECFVARPGYVLVKGDYSQEELRVYAHYTREPVLVDAYSKGLDVHQQVADALKIPRWRAKNVAFAAIYGASAPKLAETAGVQGSEATAFLNQMKQTMPSLLTWHDRISQELHTQGYVTTLLGWENDYPLFFSPVRKESQAALREAGNLPIQGTCAGIIKRLICEAEPIASRWGAGLVLTVHDEVVYEVPESAAAIFQQLLKNAAEEVPRQYCDVPLIFDVAMGPDWGHLA